MPISEKDNEIIMRSPGSGPEVSVIVPVLDEQPTIRDLALGIKASLRSTGRSFELLFIDDGSRDGSWETIREIASNESFVRGFRLRRNFGKSTALSVGAEMARGQILVTMDGDLQDKPTEIPRFLEQIDKGADLVSGWKRPRFDPLSKKVPSYFFNTILRLVSGVPLHDFNSGFKAARTLVYRSIPLYGELHRFVPMLAAAEGFEVVEITVEHQPRRFGKSKYGLKRFFRGFVDLLTVLTLTKYDSRPAHFFGGIGLMLGAVGLAILIYLSILKIGFGHQIGSRPLLLLGVMLEFVSLQVILFGLVAELIVNRTGRRPAISFVLEGTEGTLMGDGTVHDRNVE